MGWAVNLNEKGVYGDKLAACINDSVKVYANENLEEILFPLIFQLYFIKEIGNLVPHWNSRICQTNRLSSRILRTACVFFKPSLFFSSLQAAFGTNYVNTNIYFCQLLLSNVEFWQRAKWD